jgi:hypothetical protein
MGETTNEHPVAHPAVQVTEDNREELADVVIAADKSSETSLPWYVSLRPLLFCLLLLFIAECSARLYFDTTTCLEPERLDNFPGPAIEDAFVAQMGRDKAYKLVVIGDSTVVGPSLLPRNETMPGLLEAELQRAFPKRPIHVWNMSLAGARATDELCLLKKAFEGRPDFIIVQGNYFISDMVFDDRVRNHAVPVMDPWLAYNLPAVPPSLRPLLKDRSWKESFEDQLTNFVERNVRLIGMRQAINAKIFGVQPRTPFDTPNPMIMTAVTTAKRIHKLSAQVWTERGLTPVKYLPLYCRRIMPDNFNGRYYRDVMTELKASGIPALTYLTPQNPGITNVVLDPAWYSESRSVLSSFFQGYGIPHYDFSELVPGRFFEDNDHMLCEGNSRLAKALASEIAPRIKDALKLESHTGSIRTASNQ